VVAEADVDPAKPFSSILFERPSDEVQREDPSMLRDLNLDQVFAAVASGRDEYDLMPFFAAPLRDVRAVEYRHEVQQDLADDALAKAVADFALAMHEMRENLGLVGRLRERYQKERWFLDAARVYGQAVTILAEALTRFHGVPAIPRRLHPVQDVHRPDRGHRQGDQRTGRGEVLRAHQGQPGQGHQVRR
jgi:DNA mismatch repair protein MutS